MKTSHQRIADAAIEELCRIADEVRIFPLVDLAGAPSGHLAPCIERLVRLGLQVSIETVAYEFQRGANQMMRVSRPAG